VDSLDPKTTALLILDLQNDVIHADGAFAGTGSAEHATSQKVAEQAGRLAKAARAKGVKVIHVHHFASVGAGDDADSKRNAGLWQGTADAGAVKPGTWGAEPHAGVEPQDGDIVVQKQRVSAFFGTPLDIKLRGLGVEKVLVCGAWTNMSVESTIRYGADLGYEMVLVSDACSSMNADWHRVAVEYAVTSLGEVATIDEVVTALG